MFDIAALRGAAERSAKKPKIEVKVEMPEESWGKMPPPKGKPPMGGMDLAAELAECAAKYGMAPEEVIAEFKQFLADKKGGQAPEQTPEGEGDESPPEQLAEM